jgi:hypothetical protein
MLHCSRRDGVVAGRRVAARGARPWWCALGLALAVQAFSAGQLTAQEESPERTQATAKALAQSNDPLADLIGFNFNEYYASGLYDRDAVANTLNMQGVFIPVRRHVHLYHLVRATLPVATVPEGASTYASGFGDLVVQDAFKFSHPGAKTEFGLGPLLVIPTASSTSLGAGKWQAGFGVILVRLLAGGSVLGGTFTWQTSFAGDSSRERTSLATFQPDVALALGKTGYYISSTPIWTFDFENDRYLVPFSLGFGKVFMVGKTIVNVTMEPQFTVFHKGEQQPTVQLFFGLTLQRKRGFTPRK